MALNASVLNQIDKALSDIKNTKKEKEWYSLRPIIGNSNWSMYYILLGSREVGKSWAIMDLFLHDFQEHHVPFYWLRLTREGVDKLKKNNAQSLIDPGLIRHYPWLDLHVIGDTVYQVLERTEPDKNGKTKIKKEIPMCYLAACQEGSKNKGGAQAGSYDASFLDDPNMHYNICLDEFQKDYKQERNTFDVVKGFRDTIENIVRSEKERIRIFLVANLLQDVDDILAAFKFLPETWGTYKLVKNKKVLISYLKELKEAHINHQSRQAIHNKYGNYDFGMRAVIEYIPNTSNYNNRRKGTAAAIVAGDDSNFTNKQDTSFVPLNKSRLVKANKIIKFTKDPSTWFVLWDNDTIAQYKQKLNTKGIICMRPLADTTVPFIQELAQYVLDAFEARQFRYRDLISYKTFVKCLSDLKSQYKQ